MASNNTCMTHTTTSAITIDIAMTTTSTVTSSSKQNSAKKKSRVCSCLDIIRRAFIRQQGSREGGLPFTNPSAFTEQQQAFQGKFPMTSAATLAGLGDGTTAATFCVPGGDLTGQAFINQQQQKLDNIGKGNESLIQHQHGPQPSLSSQFAHGQGHNFNSNNLFGGAQQDRYEFSFIKRNEYLQKKFAPKKDPYISKNNRNINNLVVRTELDGSEIQYCEGISGNYFLLKYFRFECSLCSQLCSHILLIECCKAPICLRCTLEVCDYYSAHGQVTHCIICNKQPTTRYYVIRDPFIGEQKTLTQQTLESQKLSNKQQSRKKQQKSNHLTINEKSAEQEESLVASQIQNKSLSIVKPQRLDFLDLLQDAEEGDEDNKNTASSPSKKRSSKRKRFPKSCFEDILMSSGGSSSGECGKSSSRRSSARRKNNEAGQSPPLRIDTKQSNSQSYTKHQFSSGDAGDYTSIGQANVTSLQLWREPSTFKGTVDNQNEKYTIGNNEGDISHVYSERGVSELPKNLGGRRRIGNYRKVSGASSLNKQRAAAAKLRAIESLGHEGSGKVLNSDKDASDMMVGSGTSAKRRQVADKVMFDGGLRRSGKDYDDLVGVGIEGVEDFEDTRDLPLSKRLRSKRGDCAVSNKENSQNLSNLTIGANKSTSPGLNKQSKKIRKQQ